MIESSFTKVDRCNVVKYADAGERERLVRFFVSFSSVSRRQKQDFYHMVTFKYGRFVDGRFVQNNFRLVLFRTKVHFIQILYSDIS